MTSIGDEVEAWEAEDRPATAAVSTIDEEGGGLGPHQLELAMPPIELQEVLARRARHAELIVRYFSEKADARARSTGCACDTDDNRERVESSE
jgi:hypothetical protein